MFQSPHFFEHLQRTHQPSLKTESVHESYDLGPAIQFEAIQLVAALAVRTNFVSNNMLFQGPSLTWQDCRYELLPYLHIRAAMLRPDRHCEFRHHFFSPLDTDNISVLGLYPDEILGKPDIL